MENSKSTGIGVIGALGILFIALKLMGYITWSWWWVLAPVWLIPAIIITGLLLFYTIGWLFWRDK